MSSFEPTSLDSARRDFQPDVPGRFQPVSAQRQSAAESAAQATARLEAAAFEAGRREGLASAEAQCAPAIEALGVAAERLAEQRGEFLHAQRRAIVDLAIEIASHLIGEAVRNRPERIVDRIESALGLTDADSETRIELNPEDHAVVIASTATATLGDDVRFTENADLERGELRVASGRSTIEARHSAMLDFVRIALDGLESLPEEPGETTP